MALDAPAVYMEMAFREITERLMDKPADARLNAADVARAIGRKVLADERAKAWCAQEDAYRVASRERTEEHKAEAAAAAVVSSKRQRLKVGMALLEAIAAEPSSGYKLAQCGLRRCVGRRAGAHLLFIKRRPAPPLRDVGAAV